MPIFFTVLILIFGALVVLAFGAYVNNRLRKLSDCLMPKNFCATCTNATCAARHAQARLAQARREWRLEPAHRVPHFAHRTASRARVRTQFRSQ